MHYLKPKRMSQLSVVESPKSYRAPRLVCAMRQTGNFRINGHIELSARLNAPAAIKQTVRFEASPRLRGPDKRANRKSEAILQMEAPGRDGGGAGNSGGVLCEVVER